MKKISMTRVWDKEKIEAMTSQTPPAQCYGGHGFDFQTGSDIFFFVPRLMSC